jgi:hypothetical protein
MRAQSILTPTGSDMLMKGDPIKPVHSSAGLSGVLRLTAGPAIIALGSARPLSSQITHLGANR